VATEWYCSIAGTISGPHLAGELQSLADRGELSPSDHIRRGKDGEWIRADSVKGLKFTERPRTTAYTVKGTDRQTGRTRELVIVAASEEESFRRAAESGIVTGTPQDAEVAKELADQQARKVKAQKAAAAVGPRRWRYKMVQIPPNVAIEEGTSTRGVAAGYLELLVEKHAELGWEFYRVETIGIRINPGCLAALLGGQSQMELYYVVTFRVAVESADEI